VDFFLQFLFSGLTRGSIYALVGIGFAIVYNASHVINFAQGEFVMLGGMLTAAAIGPALGLPLWLAVPLAIAATAAIGLALQRFAVAPARGASVVAVIIITIGASIFLRGAVEVGLGKNDFVVPRFSASETLTVGGAALQTQTLWVLAGLAAVVAALKWFFDRTRLGKAMLATSHNRLAAELVGIDVGRMVLLAFGLSAALGGLAGVLTAPITITRYDVGIALGLKGFAAAILGGLGNPYGAVAGGLALGIAEAMAGGYLSSAYQDAAAFLILLAVLFVRPAGLFGRAGAERV
jgi:branched-chain amino acid transport system permease protein